jgi:hypothetical protein
MGNFIGTFVTALLASAASIGAFLYMPAKDRAEVDLKYVDIALNIVGNEKPCDKGIRTWAVLILNQHSPAEARLPAEAQASLIGGGCSPGATPATVLPLPPSATTSTNKSGSVDKISAFETEGIAALLDKNLQDARDRFTSAYNLWPVYRTTDEVRRILAAQVGNPPKNEADWKTLYARIAFCDLSGVDDGVQDRLAKAAGLTDMHEMLVNADSRKCR